MNERTHDVENLSAEQNTLNLENRSLVTNTTYIYIYIKHILYICSLDMTYDN